ncbi:MAG: hypothetical protein VB084_10725 [Syntrophomonadaceae bacterium]|nr:hypothetical protein [Syntrophomonadaceae bacterium]
MNKSRTLAALILIFCIIALPGCSNSSAAKKPAESSSGQKPKAPTQIKTMSTDLDTIISELDKKFKTAKMDVMQQNIQLIPQPDQAGQSQENQSQSSKTQTSQAQNTQEESKSGQSKTNQTGQSASDQSQNGQTQSDQVQTKKSSSDETQATTPTGQTAQTQATDWQKEFSTLKDIHSIWNTLMPEAVGAGMTITARDQFDKALEQLTQDISKQKLEQSISDALIVYKNFADLTTLFTTQVPSEFYQVKYETVSAIFEASRKDWTAANDHVPNIKEHWVYLSSQAKDTDTKLLNQTDFSLLDLERAIQSKQMELVIIKGEIAMNNLRNLEEKLSSASSEAGQSSGQNQSKS